MAYMPYDVESAKKLCAIIERGLDGGVAIPACDIRLLLMACRCLIEQLEVYKPTVN